MTEPTTHKHISEREADGSFEDCTWDSGLEFYRDAIDPSKPATHTESQLLRAASGEPPTGGSNYGDFRRGVAARYHHTLPAATSNKTILTILKPGMVGIVQGSMSAFGPTNPLSKWDRNFDGGHSAWVARTPDGVLLWCDPEAPTTADVPVIISPSDLQKFVNSFAGEAIVAPALKWPVAPAGAPTVYPINLIPVVVLNSTAVVKAQSNIRVDPLIAAAKVRTTATDETVHNVIGYVTGDKDPANGKTDWLAWLEAGKWRYTAIDNIKSITPPAATADDGFTKATQDAAVLAQKNADQAAITAANTAAAKSAAEAAAAPAIERERLALSLGKAEADKVRNS
jgi:hypothetical protein